MSRFKTLDKQLEDKAMKWYIKEYYGEQLVGANKELRSKTIKEIKQTATKKDIIKEYLNTHPKTKQEYMAKKKKMNKFKVALGLGVVTLAVGVGAYYYSQSKNKELETQQTEYTLYQEPEKEQNEYEDFFNEVKNIENTSMRDETITNFTKERIVEAYNMEHPENPITADRLQYLHLNEDVIANTDALGYEVSYERTPQIGQYIKTENQELKKIDGGIYEFKIDGNTVAVYTSNGDTIEDSSIKNEEEFFKQTLNLLNDSNKLKEIYKYRNSEYDISKIENDYENVARNLVGEKEIKEINNENIR